MFEILRHTASPILRPIHWNPFNEIEKSEGTDTLLILLLNEWKTLTVLLICLLCTPPPYGPCATIHFPWKRVIVVGLLKIVSNLTQCVFLSMFKMRSADAYTGINLYFRTLSISSILLWYGIIPPGNRSPVKRMYFSLYTCVSMWISSPTLLCRLCPSRSTLLTPA